MPLDPKLATLISAKRQKPAIWELSVEEIREGFSAVLSRTATGDTLSYDEVEWGRLYKISGARTLIVYYHGGGFVAGKLDDYDNFSARLAQATASHVLLVDYRLAPEHPYPAAHEDAVSALKWADKNIKAKQLVVMGDSAGGNLAACTANALRKPKLAAQVLINPCLDFECSYPSMGLDERDVLVSREELEWYYDTYYNLDNDCKDPSISPIYLEKVPKLPRTLILTAEYDTLRDEAESYSAKLKQAGIDVICKRYSGMCHGFILFSRLVAHADQALADIAHFLSKG